MEPQWYRIPRIAAALLAAFLIAACLVSGQSGDAWRVIGPGGGGAQFVPAISPHDARLLLVACDMTGSYLSRDGGASWRMFNLRGTTRFFTWDPLDPSTVYAGTDWLWRSNDGGVSWKLVYPAPESVSFIEMAGDHADETLLAGGRPAAVVTALAIDPADSKILYAGIGNELRISSDAGKTWRVETALDGAPRQIWIGAQSPPSQRSIYVALGRKLAIRESGRWRETPAAARPWVGVSAGLPVLYTISETGGQVSEDGGATWRAFAPPGPGAKLRAVATSGNHPDTAYVSYRDLEADGHRWFGVARTTDRGRTWKLVWKESGTAAPNIHDAWITPRFGPDWSEQPLSLGVSPDDPKLVYATDLGRTLRSTDGGETWDAVYSRSSGAGWTTSGLDVTTAYGVHFDPFDLRRIFITYTDIGAFRSEDGGQSWISATTGVGRRWTNTTYWMVFDPEVKGRAWAVVSATHDLPRPKMWRRTGVGRYRGGVVASDDGGRSWRKSNGGMPETAATHIVLDPKSPKDSRTLYVAAFGRGVYKSTDGGASWALKNAGLEGSEPFAWRLAQDSAGGLYLVVARRSERGETGDAGDGALYFSADGADHWTRLRLPEGVNGPNGLAADPEDHRRLYLAAWRRSTSDAKAGGGVHVSEDAGATWRCVLDEDQHIYDVTVDPRDPRILYACGFESSAWRSADRGGHWRRIRGYDFKWGHRVVPDPSDPAKIYVTTFGGSVWHGPAEGDPRAREAIATPRLAPSVHH